MKIKELYAIEYARYLRSLSRFYKKYGVAFDRIGRVKRPTIGSIRRLKKEREKARAFYKGMKPIGSHAPILTKKKEAIVELDPNEQRAMVAIQEIEAMLQEADDFVWTKVDEYHPHGDNPGGEGLVHDNAKRIIEALDEAKKKYTPTEILQKIENEYGDMNTLLDMLYKLLYAVFNSRNSGFAKWASRGAKDAWEREMHKMEDALK